MRDEWREVDLRLASTFARFGLVLDGIDSNLVFGLRPAWAVYYRAADCKMQICWSAREGGADFMLAPLDCPNELGRLNASKSWKCMLLLSDVADQISTPKLTDVPDVWWEWRRQIFEAHYPAAHREIIKTSH